MKDDIETRRIVYADERDYEMQRQLKLKRIEGLTWEDEQKFCDEWIAETEANVRSGACPVSTTARPKEIDFTVPTPKEDGSLAALEVWLALASAASPTGQTLDIEPGEEELFGRFTARWDAGCFNEVLPQEQEVIWDIKIAAAGLNRTLRDEVKIARYRAMKEHHWSIFKAAQ